MFAFVLVKAFRDLSQSGFYSYRHWAHGAGDSGYARFEGGRINQLRALCPFLCQLEAIKLGVLYGMQVVHSQQCGSWTEIFHQQERLIEF